LHELDDKGLGVDGLAMQ